MTEDKDLKARVEALEERVADLEERAESGGLDEIKNIRSFVESTSPNSHTERALAIGYFLEQYDGFDYIVTGDIKRGYEECRVPEPANMSDTLATLEEQELLLQTDHDGRGNAWRLSAAGEQQVKDWQEDANEA